MNESLVGFLVVAGGFLVVSWWFPGGFLVVSWWFWFSEFCFWWFSGGFLFSGFFLLVFRSFSFFFLGWGSDVSVCLLIFWWCSGILFLFRLFKPCEWFGLRSSKT